MRHANKLVFALCLLVGGSFTSAQTQGSAHGFVDERAAAFLLDAMRLKADLRRRSPSQTALGDRLWASATALVEIVTTAGDDQELYLPVIDSLHGAILQQMSRQGGLDLRAITSIEASLAEQVTLASGWGAFYGGRRGLDVEIRALDRRGREINGLYVWLDLICCIRASGSANALPSATSPSRAQVIPGTYLVRLMRNNRLAAQREVTLGTTFSRPLRLDIVVP